MEDYIRNYCTYYNDSFNKTIQQYNSNKMTESYYIDCIIDYKIENNKDIIYKEDILKICSKFYKPNMSQEEFMENVMRDMSQEEFMEKVMRDIKSHNLNINNLTIKDCFRTHFLELYYISTFLEYEPVDIKIALKD